MLNINEKLNDATTPIFKEFVENYINVVFERVNYHYDHENSVTVNADVYINDGTNDIYLVKSAPIVPGSALQVLDGGAKFVMQSGDALKIVSDTAASLDVWVSVVDDISS